MKRLIFFFSMMLIVTLDLLCQYNALLFSGITTEDGLSSSWIRCIYQDKHGFIWFGTADGLNRYDGNEIVVFRPDETERYGLVSGSINYIADKGDGKIWICTGQGVNIFNSAKNIFEPFPMLDKIRVVHVMTDDKKLTWFSTYSGIYCYNQTDSSIVNYRYSDNDPNSPNSNQVEICYQDANKNIWIATDEGLNLFDPILKTFIKFPLTKNIYDNEHILSITNDKEKRLWIAAENLGVFYIPDTKHPESSKIIQLSSGNIDDLLVDHNNHLWIGHSLGQGLEIIDLKKIVSGRPLNSLKYLSSPVNLHGLNDNSITCIMEDRHENIWLGTFAGGVNYYAGQTKKFHTTSYEPEKPNSISNGVINCFLEDNRFLWIGTEKGLNSIDTKTGKLTKYYSKKNDLHTLGADGILNIYRDKRDNLWIGTWDGGLALFYQGQHTFKRFQYREDTPGSICSNNIFSIQEDSHGILWIGTDGGGLAKFDYVTGNFKCFHHIEGDESSIYHDAVNDICLSSDGKLYISVYHSFEVFDPVKETFTHFIHNKLDTTSISFGNILDIFEDSNGNIWVATTGGLNYFNKSKGEFKRYTKHDGLPSNSIQAIQEDNSGNLWISSNNGLSKFYNGSSLPEDVKFINFFAEDGLQGNEFVRRSTLKTKEGHIFFGGSKGFTYFYPDSIIENNIIPDVVFTDLKIFNKETGKSNYKITTDINLLRTIELASKQSDFTIRFAALSYLNSEKNKYKYILEGYENEWHEIGNQHEATYTNLDPGKYVFKVFGSNNDGLWSKTPKSLEIIITRPWWSSIGAWVLYVLFGILLLYSLFKLRFRILQNQKKFLEIKVSERTHELSELNSLLEEKQEEITMQNEELSRHRNHLEQLVIERTAAMEAAIQRAESSDKLKSAFLANMSHEIRTPMNAIVGFTSLLKNEELSAEERADFIGIISNNCDILMVLINDILEISLIEANQLKLKTTPFYIDNVLEELESYFKLNNPKDLQITFQRNDSGKRFVLNNDQTRFRQIITNLLNNAYKYTEEGFINFGYEIVKNEIQFYVEDSGIGIAESEYQNIFNYFHKIDKGDNKLYRGAGIGLSISNKLVELMGGRIWLHSQVGQGTTFYFTLPSLPVEERLKDNDEIISVPILNLSGKLILIAEDEANNYVLIEKILRPTNADIIWAKNGKEAVNYVKEFNLLKDIIVLMDIKMPIMNGIHASNEIGKINSKIPVIAVTAYAQAENKEEILRHNFCDYLAKPLQPSILLKKIYKHSNLNLADF